MRLPDSYESISGAVLTAALNAVRRSPRGVDVRDVEPTYIEVVIVPILKGRAPRVYGHPLEVVGVVADLDPVAANEWAFAAARAAASDVRVRDGWAAVVARRTGGQP